jgi:hypothetical protein
MALPNPNSTTMAGNYQPWNAREAISTSLQAAFLQMQSNVFAKSPLLRLAPGSGLLRERAELKKRELYEKTGRDETGRKLTKQELEERERRKADLGALAEIRDLYVDEYKNSGVPIELKGDSNALFLFERIDANILKIMEIMTSAFPQGQEKNQQNTLDNLSMQEMADEKEAEDDRDQLESEKRQQTFWMKLFGRKTTNASEGQGFLSSIMNFLSPLFSGGIAGFLTSMIGPIVGVLGTALTTVMTFVAPLLSAIVPLIIAAAPLLIGGMLAGAAGKMLSDWITSKANEEEKKSFQQTLDLAQRKTRRKTSMLSTGEKVYEVSDSEGKTRFATANDLNLSGEQTSQLSKGDIISTDAGQIRESTYRVETNMAGKETGRLAGNLSANEILAADIAKGKLTTGQASSMDAGNKKLMELERKMADYSSSFSDRVSSAKDNSAQAIGLMDDFNRITNELDQASRRYPGIFTPSKMIELTQSKYRLFRGIYSDGKIHKDRQAYIDKDEMFGLGGKWDEMDADDLVIPGVGEFTFGEAADSRLMGNVKTSTSGTSITGTDVTAPDRTVPATSGEVRSTTPMDVPSTAAENAALKSQSSISVPQQTNMTTVSQSNNATVITPPTATRGTGVDADRPYNGTYRLSFS